MRIDKRTKTYKTLHLWFNQYTRAAFVAGIIVGSLIGFSLKQELRTSPEPLETIVSEIKADEPPIEYYQETPLRYLRYKGEQLGIDEYTITKFILVMKCESGLRPNAINKNTNGTFDLGIGQINDVHSKRISRADRLDFVKNIDYGYKLFLEQGFNPWYCARKLGYK